MAAVDWKSFRPLNASNSHLVAVGGIHSFSVTTTGTKMVFKNFTRSLQIKPLDGDIWIAATETALDGTTNRWKVAMGEVFHEVMQVPSWCIKGVSGTVAVQVLPVLSDSAIPSNFGELTAANGFNGGDSTASDTLVALS